ncbi:MAG: secretion protein HylD [Methylovirgula sp.]|uniref:HlyD family secretion protein n=1 Tax=Methylovirgula sp. TaxID=1978224 RepID=UPI0030760673
MTSSNPEIKVVSDDPDKAQPLEGEVLPAGANALVAAQSAALVPVDNPSIRKRSRWRLVAIALVALGAAGAGFTGGICVRRVCRQVSFPATGVLKPKKSTSTRNLLSGLHSCLSDEGDYVVPGQILARMDIRDVEASLRKAQAQVEEAKRSLDEAHANVAQQQTEVVFAQQEFDRTKALVARGFATYELLDQRQQTLNGANDALSAANDRVGEAERALDASTHDVELYKVNIADDTLVSPTSGRIQYRISNVGEVLPAGGKVFTMLDFTDVYMDIYLPTVEAGRARIGGGRPYRAGFLSECDDSGTCLVCRHAGAIYAEGRRDRRRTR